MVAAAVGIGSAVAGIGGSLLSSGAASSAANTQAQAAEQASANTLSQYQTTNANLSPFLTTGSNAFSQLSSIFGLTPPTNQVTSGGTGPTYQGVQLPGGWSVNTLPSGQVSIADATGKAQFQGFPDQVASAIAPGTSLGDYITQENAYVAPPAGTPPPPNPLTAYGQSGGQSGLTYSPEAAGLGNGVFNPQAAGLGNGTFQPTEAQLQATPGYQFDLSQGLLGAQNGATAQGLGVSGAAMKAGATFATGLADNTLQTQDQIFNSNLANAEGIYNTGLANTQGIFQQNLGNVINPLLQYAQLGENAGAQTGTIGANAIQSSSNLQTGAANAQAAGTVGSANALSSGLSSASNSATNYLLYNNLLGGGGTVTSGSQPFGSDSY